MEKKGSLEEAKYWLKLANFITNIFLTLGLFSVSYVLLMNSTSIAFYYKLWATFSFTVIGIAMMLFVNVTIEKSLKSIEKLGYKYEKLNYMFVILIIWIIVMFMLALSL